VCVSVAIHLGPWNFISCNFNLNWPWTLIFLQLNP
jgi:hypothetical protein